MSKHKNMQTWIETFLDGNHLYFESVNAYPNIRTMIPEYGEFNIRTDVTGNKKKGYTFAFVGYEQIDTGTSDINTDNMDKFELFSEWLETQQDNKNFPNLGTDTYKYEIIPLQNMANLSGIDENGLAKYMFGVRIEYWEK